tara:strand:- start:4734 stop:5033 length:300 start_codon:yes stop_codon:yes gene_type:complete
MCKPDLPPMPEQPDPLPAPPTPPPAPTVPDPIKPPETVNAKDKKLKKTSKRARLNQAGSGAEQLRIDLDQSAIKNIATVNTGQGTTNKKKKSQLNIPTA